MELKYYQSALILDIAEDGGIAYNVMSGGHDGLPMSSAVPPHTRVTFYPLYFLPHTDVLHKQAAIRPSNAPGIAHNVETGDHSYRTAR